MDALYEELQRFLKILDQFNAKISEDWDNLQRQWDAADEVWTNDATRAQFEREWQEMEAKIKRYRQQDAERYLQFLIQRKRALDDYFGRR